ncbi:MAG: SPOR domain-containing protein [Candidatus Omnitrophica bacterium]|nr:SPOR domain-containing protein [Candidatus Omnitrophota bacterium]
MTEPSNIKFWQRPAFAIPVAAGLILLVTWATWGISPRSRTESGSPETAITQIVGQQGQPEIEIYTSTSVRQVETSAPREQDNAAAGSQAVSSSPKTPPQQAAQDPSRTPVPAPAVTQKSPEAFPFKKMAVAPQPPKAGENVYAIQVASFRSLETASELVAALKGEGMTASISPASNETGTTWHRVQVGEFSTMDEAVAEVARLRKRFADSFVVNAE